MTRSTSSAKDQRRRDPRYLANQKKLRAKRLPCELCGGPIDYSDTATRAHSRWSFTADHRVPLAFLEPGDSRAWELSNLRPAHKRCNQAAYTAMVRSLGRRIIAGPAAPAPAGGGAELNCSQPW